ncbi:DUF4915 domain-containing protein [Nostoc sp. FACHB-892]|uniref:DUF4915 domain-containing protein n=1 Tax=Nostoc sp. FACHB-892 TaxID=2692843 RepID=UPI0018EFE01D|nr:DUF4915 domain-containing protein [Nostoc sp. FACHB-892]
MGTVSETHSFVPLWQPTFISKPAAEDRCHLNGLAMQQGKPKYVTAVSQSDVAEGWREHRANGGCVTGNNIIVAATDEILATLTGISTTTLTAANFTIV